MTIKPPLFSIVTITRNNLEGLKITTDSIRHQSCRDYEWIVVDGNSADGTCAYLAECGLPLCCISEPDEGIYDAMNKGIERAKGEYLLFLNAGDALSDMDILATIARAAAAEQPDFIYGDALETDGRYKKASEHRHIGRGMFTHHQAMLYKRGTLDGLRYDASYKIAGDYAFTHAFLKRAGRIAYIPAALCIFETGGISQRRMGLGRIEQYKARRKAGYAMLENLCVYALQTASAFLKRRAPRLYYGLKSKIWAFNLS